MKKEKKTSKQTNKNKDRSVLNRFVILGEWLQPDFKALGAAQVQWLWQNSSYRYFSTNNFDKLPNTTIVFIVHYQASKIRISNLPYCHTSGPSPSWFLFIPNPQFCEINCPIRFHEIKFQKWLYSHLKQIAAITVIQTIFWPTLFFSISHGWMNRRLGLRR